MKVENHIKGIRNFTEKTNPIIRIIADKVSNFSFVLFTAFIMFNCKEIYMQIKTLFMLSGFGVVAFLDNLINPFHSFVTSEITK